MNTSKILDFFIPKLKYGASSVIATSVDYLVFFTLLHATTLNNPTIAQIFAYSCGLLTNFFLQKKFVFNLSRSVFKTFQLSVSFSLLGLTMSTLLIYLLSQTSFFGNYLIAAKVLITGIMFLYNFYTKRFAFEGIKKTSEESLSE